MRTILIGMLLSVWGCSSIQKMAMRSATPVLVDGSDRLSLERNWELFRESMPGNIKLFEMLYLQDTDNLELLGAVVKGYAGYAFGVFETLALSDQLDGFDDSYHRKNAIALYTRSMDYGLDYLHKKGIKRSEVLGLDEQEFKKKLSKIFDKNDFKVILYTAQAWGSLINLQKDNVALVSHIPRVKILFDWVCGKDSSIENGVCDIYFAQYEASRPRMLGGNPEKAKLLFEKAIDRRPLSLLVRVSYIQHLLMPAYDSAAYEVQAKILREEFAKWEDLNRDDLVDKSIYKAEEQLNLFNSIAKKRFEIIEKNKLKIFEDK